MRQLLLSAAALVLLAAPAMAQPDNAPAHGYGHNFDQALQAKQRAQAQQGQAPQQAQPQQRAPQQGGARSDPQAGHRGGDRGMNFTNSLPPGAMPPGGARPAQPQAAPQGARPAQPQDRRGRDDNRGFNNGNRGSDNRGFNNGNGNNRSFTNGAGNRPGYGGPRHDYSSFRDFHRDFNASRRFRGPDYRRPAGWYDHRWTFGEILPGAFWARDYWLSDYGSYDLPPPPYGAVWVRVANDALLVDQESGEVITVEYGVFY